MDLHLRELLTSAGNGNPVAHPLLCMRPLLSDMFFLNVTIIPFTGERAREQSNFAITFLKYATLPSSVGAWLPLVSAPWIEISKRYTFARFGAIVVAHLALRSRHRAVIRGHCNLPSLEEDEEDFPLTLRLRY